MYLSNHVRVSHGLHGLLKRVFFLSFFHIYQPPNMRRSTNTKMGAEYRHNLEFIMLDEGVENEDHPFSSTKNMQLF